MADLTTRPRPREGRRLTATAPTAQLLGAVAASVALGISAERFLMAESIDVGSILILSLLSVVVVTATLQIVRWFEMQGVAADPGDPVRVSESAPEWSERRAQPPREDGLEDRPTLTRSAMADEETLDVPSVLRGDNPAERLITQVATHPSVRSWLGAGPAEEFTWAAALLAAVYRALTMERTNRSWHFVEAFGQLYAALAEQLLVHPERHLGAAKATIDRLLDQLAVVLNDSARRAVELRLRSLSESFGARSLEGFLLLRERLALDDQAETGAWQQVALGSLPESMSAEERGELVADNAEWIDRMVATLGEERAAGMFDQYVHWVATLPKFSELTEEEQRQLRGYRT